MYIVVLQTDVHTMSTTIRQLGIDADQIPFARLKKSAVLKARDILGQIKYV